MTVENLNFLLAFGTVAMLVMTVGFFAVYFLRSKFPDLNDIGALLKNWGVHLSVLLAFSGAFFTLFYSEVLGFEPCFLCWWQRICLYPQILMFALALKKPYLRASASTYSIWLSSFGALFALYHHILQVYPAGHLPCSATGPSCAKITFIEFGFVTYPMMALALFAMLIVVQMFLKENQE